MGTLASSIPQVGSRRLLNLIPLLTGKVKEPMRYSVVWLLWNLNERLVAWNTAIAKKAAFSSCSLPLSAEREAALIDICRLLNSRGKVRVLEIGTWFGEGSTKTFLENLNPGSTLISIDLWLPYHAERSKYQYRLMNLMTGFALNNCQRIFGLVGRRSHGYQLSSRAHSRGVSGGGVEWLLIRGNSLSAMHLLQHGSFDCVFIDGAHDYKTVKGEIEVSQKLIKVADEDYDVEQQFMNSGIICGDDLDVIPSYEKYLEAIPYSSDDYHDNYHPGVLRAITESFQYIFVKDGIWTSIAPRDGDWIRVPLALLPES